MSLGELYNPAGRNPRSVLSPSPEPFSGAHFAVYPSGLIEPLIKATCPAKCCPECGMGWSPVVERERTTSNGRRRPSPPGSKKIATNHPRLLGALSISTNILGYRPSCGCGNGLLPDDLETIATPTGKRNTADPSLETGRAGFNRPRGPDEGSRPITRYEQRKYATQLRNSPHRDKMEAEAGSAFAHYIRTDKSGARPAPPDLLEKWIERGWVESVQVPESQPLEPVPGVVLDPFMGSGRTAVVAIKLGLRFYGCDISQKYVDMANEEIAKARLEVAQLELNMI